jgi:hypothetical protein
MRPVEHAVEVVTVPPRDEIDPHLQCARDGPDRLDGLTPHLAALESGDHRLRDPGPISEVALAPPV